MNYRDIPQFPQAHYEVDVPWDYLEDWLARMDEERGVLDLDPDFQRAHVWTPDQQTRYVEYILRGGEVSKTLFWNHPSWMTFVETDRMVLVDGKQRLEAVRAFLRDEVVVFGHRHSQFEGRRRLIQDGFKMRVGMLKTRAEVLRWYLAINAGGTPHTKKELDKVRDLLRDET